MKKRIFNKHRVRKKYKKSGQKKFVECPYTANSIGLYFLMHLEF